jgi:hypothetical protein
MNEIGLRFDGLAVRVSSRDRSHLAWLEEFFTPWFEVVAAGECECEVAIVADDREYARRLAGGARSDGAVAHCFALDRGSLQLPLGLSLADGTIVFDRRLRAFYEVGAAPRRVRVLVRPNDLSVRFAIMRIVRELAQERARSNGHLLLHAAALSLGDRTYVIAGPKGAGKTSLLVGSLLAGEGRFVSNDRIVVGIDSEGAVVHGMPTLVSVRHPTLDAYPDLRRGLERSSYHHLHALGEGRENPKPWHEGRTVDLSPAQLCALLDAPAAARGRLAALLFLRSYSPGGAATLGALDRRAAEEHIAGALLGAAAHHPAESFFAPMLAQPVGTTVHRDVARELAARVPSFELRTEAVASGGVAAHELLRGLGG